MGGSRHTQYYTCSVLRKPLEISTGARHLVHQMMLTGIFDKAAQPNNVY